MQIKLIMLLLILTVSTGCSSYKYDGFDPTTAAFRWIIKGVNDGR